jgi:hypothetical protein
MYEEYVCEYLEGTLLRHYGITGKWSVARTKDILGDTQIYREPKNQYTEKILNPISRCSYFRNNDGPKLKPDDRDCLLREFLTHFATAPNKHSHEKVVNLDVKQTDDDLGNGDDVGIDEESSSGIESESALREAVRRALLRCCSFVIHVFSEEPLCLPLGRITSVSPPCVIFVETCNNPRK